MISPYLVHRHPEFWPDPAGFDPRRFLPGGAGDIATRERYAFIPFGGGRRACVGAAFAELETVLVLATVARRFRLELTARGMPSPVAQVTLRPAGTCPCTCGGAPDNVLAEHQRFADLVEEVSQVSEAICDRAGDGRDGAPPTEGERGLVARLEEIAAAEVGRLAGLAAGRPPSSAEVEELGLKGALART